MKTCSTAQVDRAFKLSEQFIDSQIGERLISMPRFWVNMFPVKPFPDGVGLTLDKVRFFGDIGPQYDGFDGWRKVEISRSATESALRGDHDACGYKWEDVGHGLETISYSLFQRDLRTRPVCIKDIRTFWQYQEVQSMIYKNLANITANMREQLNRNAAMSFAVKYVALPGFPINADNPYNLPQIPTNVKVGKLTYSLLKRFYPQLAQEAGEFAVESIGNAPAFGVCAHPDTLDQMVYDDPEVRQDIRLQSPRDGSLIKKYGLTDRMGQFVFMPDMYAPRYSFDTAGNLVRVMPWDNNIEIEIGTRPVTSAAYHNARFELVLLMTKGLFSLRTRKAISSVGGATDFDSETAMFEWKWHNPPCKEDPYRRTGRYVTTGEIGVEPGDFTDIVAILVERKPEANVLSFWPDGVSCTELQPVEECVVTSPDTCPQVVGCCGTIESDQLLLTFNTAPDVSDEEAIELVLANGGTIAATVKEISADGTKLVVEFATDVQCEPGAIVAIKCDDSPGFCTSTVSGCIDCRSNTLNAAWLYLDRALKCMAVGDYVQVCFGDGTQAAMQIQTVDAPNLRIAVRYSTGPYGGPYGASDGGSPSTYDLCCDRKGVMSVCCLGTDGCPACEPCAS